MAGPWAAAVAACVTLVQRDLGAGAVQPWVAAAVLLSVAVAALLWVVAAGRSAGVAAAASGHVAGAVTAAARWPGRRWQPVGRTLAAKSCCSGSAARHKTAVLLPHLLLQIAHAWQQQCYRWRWR